MPDHDFHHDAAREDRMSHRAERDDDPPDEDDLDGYPTEKQLCVIRAWTPGPKWSGRRPWLPILQLMHDAWNHDMGKVTRDGDVWTFITGGWSGNEEVLGALRDHNIAWAMLWLESHRGGKHLFGVREKDD